MRKLSLVVALVLALALTASSLVLAQREGRRARRGAPTERRAGPPGAPTAAEISEMLKPLGLSAAEQTAAEKAVNAKIKAHQELRQQFDKLQEVAANKSATPQQLTSAFDQYAKALDRYRTLVRNEDRALVASLTPRGRVVCLAAGVLDNGGMGGRRGGGGGGMRGGGGGMRGGGGGGMRRGAGGGGRGG